MGKEQAGKGKHLFLCFACLIALQLGLQGCLSYFEKTEPDMKKVEADQAMAEADQYVALAKSLRAEGEYEAAFRASHELFLRHTPTHGDEALLEMALIYAHPSNPNFDYQTSLQYLNKLAGDFPKSHVADDGLMWTLTIQKILEKEREIDELRKTDELHQKALGREEEEIQGLQQHIANLQAEIKDLQLERKTLNHSIEELTDQIRKLKEIDLKIEEKRRNQ
jgi:CRISPR/Cas system CMR-associated protein Cmr5 small subunit